MRVSIAIWEAVEPRSTVSDICGGNGQFRLTEKDVEFLASLLDHNFLTARQVPVFGSPTYMRNRFLRLFREGVIARAKVPEMGQRYSHGRSWEYAYGLTSVGFQCLVFNQDDTAVRLDGTWEPPFRKSGGGAGLLHQVHLADLCVGIDAYIGSEALGLSWVGTGHVEIRVPGEIGRRPGLTIRPDAVFYTTTSDRLIVEHQRVLDTRKVTDHFDDYAEMFAHKAWSEWERPPVVLFSVSDVPQQRWANPVDRVRQVAGARRPLHGHLFIIKESDWRMGRWTVVDANPKADPVDLFDVTARPFLADPAAAYMGPRTQ